MYRFCITSTKKKKKKRVADSDPQQMLLFQKFLASQVLNQYTKTEKTYYHIQVQLHTSIDNK